MRYIADEGRIVWSASDLKAAAECEFAWLRGIDARLGRVAAVDEPEDATLARAGRLGDAHEARLLAGYRAEFGDGVREVPQTRSSDAAGLASALAATAAALADPAARVVYQAAFTGEDFVGFADFLLRDADGRWIVQDAKLARRARVTALMQLAAYADRLDAAAVPRADTAELLLGDGTTSRHRVDDVMPVFRLRRQRLRRLIADRRVEQAAAGAPIAWGDERGDLRVAACGRCATCDAEVVAARDLLLVAGMRPTQRSRLREAGIDSIDHLASALAAPARMSADTFAGLQTQARLQLRSPAGVPTDHEPLADLALPAVPEYEVVLPQALAALPRPDAGDLFFDFEGDPLYGGPTMWGIDYLFGWVDQHEQYTALWAHDFAQERAALLTFLDYVRLRRQQHPDLHIYHYAPYEPTHLFEMARRHGVGEADVDRLLREGVFVDLYPIVRRALRVGSRSYSIKKLEPLYMGAEVRTSDVQRGDDSIVKYVESRALVDEGRDAQAQAILDDLADYNRYDCVSTRRLRDWLVQRAVVAGLSPSPDVESVETPYAPSPRAEALQRLAADAAADDAQTLRLAAAAIDYHPREAKTFWASHFLRLREPVSFWADQRDVVVVDAARSHVEQDWHAGPRSMRRLVRLRGEPAPGTQLKAGGEVYAVYLRPAPFPVEPAPRLIHAARQVEVVEVLDDGAVIAERAVDGQTWHELPVALMPPAPPRTANQQAAIEAWADDVLTQWPRWPADAATDILRRRPPRLREEAASGPADAAAPTDDVAAITRRILALDRSHSAVQGPPGTGKTYVGSHVIARLVQEHSFKVGVVAQSHAVVENMLDRVVEAGVPAAQVGKALKDAAGPAPRYTAIAKAGAAAFAADHAAHGFVLGGTSWDFSHPGRVAPGSLDLLVIDEAGQFSLAATIAVSRSATRLLLLGDPQQLPQVSQGTHPEPIDTSALGWLLDGAEVIPDELGHFLARTWRMHPAVAQPVSRLSYAGRLASHPVTAAQRLRGVQPGVHPLPVAHTGNATESPEEAEAVTRLVRELLGREWTAASVTDGEVRTDPGRPLTQADLIVVTPYNAQQVTVEQALADAGFGEVRVGTVDKFQGQEAVVSIVTLAASSARDAPRGLEFLLLQNRLNVAVSRARYAAYLVYSPGLLDDLPRTPEGVARLSAFARLVHAGAAEQPS